MQLHEIIRDVIVFLLPGNNASCSAFPHVEEISTAMIHVMFLIVSLFLPDLVSNITVARQGFPRMAIAACFGGPVFSILAFCINDIYIGVLHTGPWIRIRCGLGIRIQRLLWGLGSGVENLHFKWDVILLTHPKQKKSDQSHLGNLNYIL